MLDLTAAVIVSPNFLAYLSAIDFEIEMPALRKSRFLPGTACCYANVVMSLTVIHISHRMGGPYVKILHCFDRLMEDQIRKH